MTLYYHLVHDGAPSLWGLSSKERIVRVLRRLTGETPVAVTENRSSPDGSDRVLVIRGDHLFDERVLDALLKRETGVVLEHEGLPVVAWVDGAGWASAVALVQGESNGDPGLLRLPATEIGSGIWRKLRKVSPLFVHRITPANAAALEHHLFNESYKGVTDLVTKWLWPYPAERVVRWCVSHGIRPNHVTAMSWMLALAAGLLFYQGYLGLGLVLGWLMTFLDTVDGKLARVTVDSSRFGHFFDHVLDVLHPPLWYLAWGLGLSDYQPAILKLSLMTSFWLLLAGYVAGRLIEAAFKKYVAGFSIFTWRPLDSVNRLITARRNPCLILLTVFWLAGRPDLGFEAVALWTLISTGFLGWRLVWAFYCKTRGEKLVSWLDRLDPERARGIARWFIGKTVPALS